MKATHIFTLLAALLAASTTASAQEGWTYGFRMGGGQTFQDLKAYTGKAGYAWGGEFEASREWGKDGRAVLTLGYRFLPGDFQQVSLAPSTLPTRAVAGTYTLETRMRKAEAEGFQLGALYRQNLPLEGCYGQAGVRLGYLRSRVVDTGTSFTQTVTTTNSAGSITAVKAIASQLEDKTFSPGVLAGVGYRLSDTYSLELNAYTARILDPVSGEKRGGPAYEFLIAIKF